MARFDKYDPVSGGFRGPLAADIISAQVGTVIGVSVNGSGQIAVGGASQRGVICPTRAMAAGEPIDVMTEGEIVDMAGLTAGTAYGAQADGDLAAGNGVGFTVEAWRLIVRVGRTFTATA